MSVWSGKSKAKVRSGESDGPVEYEDMGVKELRTELRRRKLGQLGGKKTLIRRLEEDDRAIADGAGSAGSPGSPLAASLGAPVFSFMKSNRSRAEIEREMKEVGAAMAAATASQQFERLASMATQMASLKKELEQLPDDEPAINVGAESSGFDISGFGAAQEANDHRNIRLTATADLTTALTDFMRKHDPAKTESAAALAAAIDGDDDAVRDLFLDLRKEYGVFPAWTGVKKLFGNGGSTIAGAAAGTSADDNDHLSVDGLKEAILEFYARRAPEKVKNADAIVRIYGASRDMLVRWNGQCSVVFCTSPCVRWIRCSSPAGRFCWPAGKTLRSVERHLQ